MSRYPTIKYSSPNLEGGKHRCNNPIASFQDQDLDFTYKISKEESIMNTNWMQQVTHGLPHLVFMKDWLVEGKYITPKSSSRFI